MACLDEPTVLAFVGGKIPPDALDPVDDHLAGCRACRDLVVHAARTTLAVGTGTGKPPTSAVETRAAERYAISDVIGTGGQAHVYKAEDTLLGRTVALKILRDARGRGDILEEARTVARLNHPNIVALHDAGTTADGQLYLAMEYVAGGSLDRWLAGKPPRRDVLRVCIAAGRGLAAAHEAGIVHRDIKAANILIGSDGRARVTDFGLAIRGTADERIAGTLAYMAPEQLDGQASTASDQFSYAVMVWEALTGELPFAPGADRAAAILDGPRAPARALPVRLSRALRRALDPEPARRWPNVRALVDALARDPLRRWQIAGALGAVGAAAVTVAVVRGGAAPCRDLGAPITASWNLAAHTRIEQAFGAAHAGYAKAAAEDVVAALDRYATDWTAARIGACRATSVAHDQSADMLDRRNACLDERAAAFAATVDALGKADDAVIEHGIDLVRGLPPLAPCSDLGWLGERVRPPADAATRARVADASAQVARTAALWHAGKTKDAIAAGQLALAAAKQIGYAPASAQAALALGQAQLSVDPAAAEASLLAAAQLAQAGHDDRGTAEAFVELVKVVGHANGRYAEALRYAGFAEASAKRLGNATELLGRLDHYRCSIFDLQAKLDEADAACTRAMQETTEAFGADAPELADVLIRQARLAVKRGKIEVARPLADRARILRERAFGPRHPTVIEALFTQGQVEKMAGNLDAADTLYAEAEDLAHEAHAEDTVVMASLLGERATIASARGQLPVALDELDRSIKIMEKSFGPDHADLTFQLLEKGRVLEDMGKDVDAIPVLDRARQIAEKTLGESHPTLSVILQDLGRVHVRLGKTADGLAELQRAVAVAKAAADPITIAFATSAHADALLMADRPAEAAPLYEQVIALHEQLGGPKSLDLIEPLTNLGLAKLDLHDPRAAIPILERAIELETARSGAQSAQLLLPLGALGDAYAAAGDRKTARALRQRAAELKRSNSP